MDLSTISKTIFEKKSKDYIYIIFFLLVFSVFIFFAIKPSLTTAYSLKKEEVDLTKIDKVYEEKIDNITLIQTQIEENRDNLPLLNQSISEQPQVNKIVEDIKKVADKNSVFINKATIVNVNFSKSNTEKQDVELKMEGSASFENVKNFITDIYAQRRLKLIKKLVINRDKESTDSGNLKVILTVDGFYL
ncbi:MAG: type 4a pilus biogenesis protein PilO [Candidatus Roizmanbacteria bacterium]|nr:type 4a pilus biogenesis protein PilO [Candidatus Roizmanbacteria bacterium]